MFALDTGPLLDHLILSHLSHGAAYEWTEVPPQLSPRVEGLRGADVRRAFHKTVHAARRILTISAVFTELERLVRPGRLHTTAFWVDSLRLLQRLALEELPTTIRDVAPSAFITHGGTDELLLRMAASHRIPLLSNDRGAMRPRARELGVRVVHPSELVQ